MSATDIQDVADQYLRTIEQEVDDNERIRLEEEQAQLADRYERSKERHGEDHHLTQRIKDKLDDVEEELEEKEVSQQATTEVRDELLNITAAEFELSDEWLTPNVLKSVNHSLVGEQHTELIVDGTSFSCLDDLSEVDDLERFDIEETVILLAEDRLGETDEITATWTRLQEGKCYEPFLVMAEQKEASPDDVLDALNGDVSRKDAKNWLEIPIYHWDQLIPYYRVGDGTFGLSTSGQYFAAHYVSIDKSVVDDNTSPDDVRNEEGVDSQMRLDEMDEEGVHEEDDNEEDDDDE